MKWKRSISLFDLVVFLEIYLDWKMLYYFQCRFDPTNFFSELTFKYSLNVTVYPQNCNSHNYSIQHRLNELMKCVESAIIWITCALSSFYSRWIVLIIYKMEKKKTFWNANIYVDVMVRCEFFIFFFYLPKEENGKQSNELNANIWL